MSIKTLFGAPLAAILLIAAPATAATYTIAYNDPATPLVGSLVLTTDDTLNGYGGYAITGISGSVGGDAITGLILGDGSEPCGCFPEGFGALGGFFSLTNTLYLSATDLNVDGQLFDHGGVGFQSATNYYDLYGIGGGTYEVFGTPTDFTVDPDTGYPLPSYFVSDGTAAAVPEPASWSLMILGFGVIGGALRRRRSPVFA